VDAAQKAFDDGWGSGGVLMRQGIMLRCVSGGSFVARARKGADGFRRWVGIVAARYQALIREHMDELARSIV
jgi:hypothetical protein